MRDFKLELKNFYLSTKALLSHNIEFLNPGLAFRAGILPEINAVKKVSGTTCSVCRDVENRWPPTLRWTMSPVDMVTSLYRHFGVVSEESAAHRHLVVAACKKTHDCHWRKLDRMVSNIFDVFSMEGPPVSNYAVCNTATVSQSKLQEVRSSVIVLSRDL